ncbi:MAG: endonuclease/exonuclease/phosphatase family protein [Chitinophagaceae bacterium]
MCNEKINFVLIHAKANTSPTATSYARRQASANELHDTLITYFPNDNIIILGDFNDDLDRSITAGFTTTSYSSFTTDNANFFSPTLALSLAGKKSTVSYNDVIDHVLLSNELQPYYLPSTANILTDVASLVSNYGKTTTDHYPVFTRYQFKNTHPPEIASCPTIPAFCGSGTIYLSTCNYCY